MAIRSLKLVLGGGGQSEAAGDDLPSEKGHLLAKRALFSTITPPPPLGTALQVNYKPYPRPHYGNKYVLSNKSV